MNHRTHILLSLVFACVFLVQQSSAQESPDDKPHIQPRATPTPTPAAKGSQTQKPDEYDRPPFPGDAPGTRPTSKSPDGYERPPFPGEAAEGNSSGESSSRDSQIDLKAGPAPAEPTPAEDDDSILKPWDPHKAAKDVEVGQYYLKLKNYRAALERFNHALVYKSDDAEATYYLAVTQEKLGLLAQAGQNYHKYLVILPNGPRSKEASEGIERLGPQVAALKPAAAPADSAKTAAHNINVGETYLSANNFDAARERFEEALRLNPDNPLVYFRLAQSLQGMQRLDPARMYYRKYLELEPRGKFARNAKKAIGEIDDVLGK